MKKRMHWLLLMLVCCAIVLPGCRRKPIETETQTETQTETESETEKKTEKQTEKKSEKQTETNKRKTVSPNSSTNNAPRTPGTNQTQSETTATTEASAQENTYDTCPYCGGSFSTTLLADGTSEYSSHVAQEEAYIDYINGTSGNTTTDPNQNYDSSDDGGQFDSTGQYGQCTYCFQWFSTVPDASGYSPYANHIAAEEAYAMQNSQEEYLQCPNCGNWVTQSDYNDHIANGW